jgi:prepilin-type N-terminal cleavage/methylation domain-containing protein
LSQLAKPYHMLRQRGFTVIEIIVVVILMALALFPIVRAIMIVLSESGDDQHQAVAAYLAVEEIEQVRALAECYTDSKVAGSMCPIVSAQSGWGASGTYNRQAPCNYPAPFQKYQCTVQYSDSNAGLEASNVREVMVRVWFDADDNRAWATGEPKVELQTMLSKRPPLP